MRKKHKLTDAHKGFTLIELLLYMGLFSILLVSLMQLFGAILEVKLESEATSAVAQDGRYILERLAYDVHRAETIDEPVVGTPGNVLHVQGSSIDNTYQITNGDLILIDNTAGSSDQLNSADTSLSQIDFTKLANTDSHDAVRVQFVLESKVIRQGGRHQVQTFQTTIETR